MFGVGDNVKPIVIGTVIVLAVVLDAYRDRFLRAIESRSFQQSPRYPSGLSAPVELLAR